MDKKKLYTSIAAFVLSVVAVGLLYRAFTWSDYEPMVLSKATLQGKVTYKGKPVPNALIILAGTDSSSTGMSDNSGNFEVPHAPVGEIGIGVNTAAGRGMMMGAMMSAAMTGNKSEAPKFVDVPVKYFAPETSGLRAKLDNKKGLNEFNIVIK